MNYGNFYGIGVGPGDPELITVKGMKILSRCKKIFVPKARIKSESIALKIAASYIRKDAEICEVVFPMVEDKDVLRRHWDDSADNILQALSSGEDACFLTLGDTLLYSTYIYLARALRHKAPELNIVTVPGITAFSAAAALTHFSIGETRNPVTIIPTSDNLEQLDQSLNGKGTIVLMKVGKRLPDILTMLARKNLLKSSVFVARAGLEGEQIVTDLSTISDVDEKTGYLSIILVDTERNYET
jgi:precorrin-2/cobalt-factor-2 C20-methyltransferase